MFRKKKIELGRDFLLYGLSFLLLAEWILPLPHIANTGYIFIFLIVTALFFAITFCQLPLYLSLGLKVTTIIVGLNIMFFDDSFFSLGWVGIIIQDLSVNIGAIFSGQWYELTDMFRSFLFFLLLAILSYLLFYWTVIVRRILFFFIFTVIYITVIDTFTVYDATFAIIRTFILGFLLVGLSSIYRMVDKEKWLSFSKNVPKRLVMMMVVLLMVASTFGILLPKYEAKWDDPVPVLRQMVGLGPGGGTTQKIGYGANDTRLGGGFVQDTTPLFRAETTRSHYWRGETKDFYTGHGWEVETPDLEIGYNTTVGGYGQNTEAVEFEQLTTTITFVDDERAVFPHLFYPGEFLGMIDYLSEYALWQYDPFTAKVSTYNGDRSGDEVALSSYTLEYEYPTFYLEELRNLSRNAPADVVSSYTQLPETVPQRVYDLAAEIIAEETNVYDQAKAIERFLAGPDFEYETEDVPVPAEGQDYVDQFLFETQRGYCDNFSTAMVVMLRANDIPARWVKGFTNGSLIDSEMGTHVYEVTNGNAHSWVEVYFDEVGWVPFEPTKGYNHSFEFISSQTELDDAIDAEDAPEVEQEEEDLPEEDVEEEAEEEQEEEQAAGGSSSGSDFHINWLPLMVIVILLLILAFILRKKIIRQYLLFRFKYRDDKNAFVEAYEKLLWYAEYCGYKRMEGETLREYAKRIDKETGVNGMFILTEAYEPIFYGGKLGEASWKEQKERWIYVVQKITA
ncbi:peptidase [Alkalihalobacillus alcalophilus ATCC 27647 = CGMCC 1.3604]|uniref:Peptidase n=1 Tax=Alkalihalobacillus alcalophilus ATCC 27647 = CGMCC 1.3604 TaxID=1218173 RepID=A0A094YQA2_ALKAL|nr:transglutaminaseTgpA domain-containing protein [Alkalihalobacillus alcalophilus]KGA95652.1 hypothetical protein BALCAV_0221130 [Alkalihalobacillus alcalophilus ATCC 27647 = CGMCC 1.3604]MED1562832.1 transglutaminaseTgpA domain-containing protein [Alkalihalobacillus alcalophilus]THG89337.1 peptidase [Alkalihalobacillus alcalophilus ATCC 27647 = CGMCC 1.3604]